MDYSNISDTNNRDIVSEFIKLMNNNEPLAIEYVENLAGILLTKEIQRPKQKYYLIFTAILNGKEDFVLNMVEQNFVDPNLKDKERNENLFFFSVTHRRFEMAVKLFDTGLFNPIEINNEGQEPLDYIEFENDVENDPKKEIKIVLLIKLLYYYIKKNDFNDSFQATVQYICDKPALIVEMKNILKKNKELKINVKKFIEIINLDNPQLFCSQPVNTESSNFVNVLDGSSIGTRRTRQKIRKAKVITPVIAFRDNSDDFEMNDYDTDEEIEFMLPKRTTPGGKKIQKKGKTLKKYKKRKTNKNLR
jgi:hypothetical protein